MTLGMLRRIGNDLPEHHQHQHDGIVGHTRRRVRDIGDPHAQLGSRSGPLQTRPSGKAVTGVLLRRQQQKKSDPLRLRFIPL